MFSSSNLFKNVCCPQRPSCRLPNCIFSHDFDLDPFGQSNHESNDKHGELEDGPPPKRRKIEDDNVSTSTLDDGQPSLPTTYDIVPAPLTQAKTTPLEKGATHTNQKDVNSIQQLRTAKRPISPPPIPISKKAKKVETDCSKLNKPSTSENPSTRQKPSVPKKPSAPEKEVSLNPQLLIHSPASHDKRRQYVIKIHENMLRLNNLAQKSEESSNKQFVLTNNELKQLALDEEEKIARDSPAVYPNLIRQRLVAYSRMALEDWLASRRVLIQDTGSEQIEPPDSYPRYNSELTSEEELLILPRLQAYLPPLAHHGYVTSQISDEDITKARNAVIENDYMEECDLCHSKIKVFPERRESDGALTSNLPCERHPLKAYFPWKDSALKSRRPREKIHPCCGEPEGSPPCDMHGKHVFTIKKSPARLASIMPFVETPEVDEAKDVDEKPKPAALTFDCEMGYTTNGLELIRITATEWPNGKELLDVLVRPLGPIIDFNSRFSGVWPKDFVAAVRYDGVVPPPPKTPDEKKKGMPIVDSPKVARTLLMSLITPTTPLIGHAIDNDLNSIRLIHPTIIDTVLQFPHPKRLPFRRSLRELAKKYLGWDIQKGGKAGASSDSNEGGHDSREDALATGELMRVAAEREWRKLKGEGWKIEGGQLVAPPKRDAKV